MSDTLLAKAAPTGRLRLRTSHPLAQRMALLMPLRGPADLLDLVSGRMGTRNGTPGQALGRYGEAVLFGAGNSVEMPQPTGITSGTEPVTFLWLQEPRATSGYSTVINWKPSGATYPFLVYLSVSDSNYYFSFGPRDSTPIPTFETSEWQVQNGRADAYALVCSGGTGSTSLGDYTLYRNGVRHTPSTTSLFASNTTASARIGALDGGGDPFEGLIGHLHIVRGAMLPAEVSAWFDDPFALEDDGRRIWLPPQVAGGGFSAPAGRADEAAQALAMAARLSAPAGLATEASAALALPARLVQAVGLASESSSALAPSAALQSAAGLAVETDEALALSPAGAVQIPAGRADSAESPLALSARLLSPVQLASEFGTAFALSPSSVIQIPTGLAVELCAALAPSARLVRQAGVAHETGIALALLHAGAAVITTPARRRLTIAAHPRRLSLPAHRRRLGIPFHARRLVIPGDT